MTDQSNRLRSHSLSLAALVAASILAAAPVAAEGPWTADGPHTEINFSVTHFFTPVSGSFRDHEIDLDYDPDDPENSSVEARIAVASVDTGNQRRDDHLRSADWFEADAHPYIIFKSNAVRQVAPNRLVASGPLTIKGRSRQVELPITLLGVQQIPEQMREMLGGSKQVASFEASTVVDRGDFDVGVGNWAATMVVGGEVDIRILLEAHQR